MIDWWMDDRLYCAILHSLEQTHCVFMWFYMRDLLRATAVTRGWNGYRNKSQHRKLTLEKKILPPLLQGFKLATFRSRVRRSNHWASPAPVNQNNGLYTGQSRCFTASHMATVWAYKSQMLRTLKVIALNISEISATAKRWQKWFGETGQSL